MKNQIKNRIFKHLHLCQHVNLKLHFPHNISLVFHKRQVSFTLPWMCSHCSRRDRQCAAFSQCVSFCSQWMLAAMKSHMFKWLRCAFCFCLWWSVLCLADWQPERNKTTPLTPTSSSFPVKNRHLPSDWSILSQRSRSAGVDGDSSCDPWFFHH